LAVPGGAINVIPGRCELTLDIRAGDNAIRDAALADVLLAIEQIAARRKVAVKVDKLMSASAAPCAPAMQQAWADSIRRVSPPVSPHVSQVEPMFLPSGAGHDAMKMAEITPMGMLFVRCGNGGISHHPAETMTTADADLAARAFADFIRNFGKQA
jgi:allantoate deiminase/N-carbamoyl-L-amino-acid hydrolase